jgi:hypothetical protein
MNPIKKILTVEEERELEIAYLNIRHWYGEQLAKHKAELPEAEYKIARQALKTFMAQVKDAYETQDPAVFAYWKQTIWFMLPWPVLLWYSFNKKK